MKKGAKEKPKVKDGGGNKGSGKNVALKLNGKVQSKVALKPLSKVEQSAVNKEGLGPSAVGINNEPIPEPKGVEEINDQKAVVEDENEKTDWAAEGIDPKKDISKKHYTKTKSTDETNALIIKLGYQLENQIGKGGFGIVKRAIQSKSNKEVAIKIIDVKMKEDDKMDEAKKKRRRQRRMDDLRHELHVLEKVRHENIIELIEHFMIDDILYIAMEYADGGTIGDLLKESKKPFTESKARRWFIQTCRAVHYMHQRGFSHRDIKLANILLKKPRDPVTKKAIAGHRICKVSDFGLSRVSWSDSKGPQMCVSYVGTVPYMAPEIFEVDIANEKGEDAKGYNPMIADIWALGVCLYGMLTRAYPYNPDPKVNSKSTVVQLMKDGSYKYPSRVRKLISSEAKDLIRNMLTYDVDARITFAGILTHDWFVRHGKKIKETHVTDTTRTKTGGQNTTTTQGTNQYKITQDKNKSSKLTSSKPSKSPILNDATTKKKS